MKSESKEGVPRGDSASEAAKAFVSDLLRSVLDFMMTAKAGEAGKVAHNVLQMASWMFPGVAFRSAAIRDENSNRKVVVLEWKDGPTQRDVAAITRWFEDELPGKAEEMEAKAETAWSRTFGSVGQVKLQRHYSDGAIRLGVQELAKTYGQPFKDVLDVRDEALRSHLIEMGDVTLGGRTVNAHLLLMAELNKCSLGPSSSGVG